MKRIIAKIITGVMMLGMTAFAIGGGSLFYHAVTNNAATICEARNYYILPYSDSEYLSEKDLAGLNKYDLRLARNEIYARHGRKFKTDSIQDYFDSQSWYDGRISPSKFDEDVLNKYENANIKLIRRVEKGKKSSTPTKSSNYYILPYSDSQYLTYSDIKGMSSYTLKKARNEIYARHGRKFKNKKLRKYFNQQSWYHGTIDADDFKESVLNKYEVYNVKFILDYE